MRKKKEIESTTYNIDYQLKALQVRNEFLEKDNARLKEELDNIRADAKSATDEMRRTRDKYLNDIKRMRELRRKYLEAIKLVGETKTRYTKEFNKLIKELKDNE